MVLAGNIGSQRAEQMRLGTIAVREALPSNVAHVTDKEIQESLWHYYYDVEKSVAYLVSKHTPKQKVAKKEHVKGKEGKAQGGLIYFSFAVGGAAGEGKGRVVRGGLPFVFFQSNGIKRVLLISRSRASIRGLLEPVFGQGLLQGYAVAQHTA
jgi:HBS1 N-terminus